MIDWLLNPAIHLNKSNLNCESYYKVSYNDVIILSIKLEIKSFSPNLQSGVPVNT